MFTDSVDNAFVGMGITVMKVHLEKGLEEVIAHCKLGVIGAAATILAVGGLFLMIFPGLISSWCNDKNDEPSSESTNGDEECVPIMDDRASCAPNRSGRTYDRINEVIEVQVITVNSKNRCMGIQGTDNSDLCRSNGLMNGFKAKVGKLDHHWEQGWL
ncbi:unnamed protein product [Toxocara canis]|uniref:CNNM transmembrane domain-containing protein n=1 Tax=Toxocara canis TaxID=6265 RepID=A0A183ULQ8_TOXCA|nr:unnamed protein product [Toxocara canis]